MQRSSRFGYIWIMLPEVTADEHVISSMKKMSKAESASIDQTQCSAVKEKMDVPPFGKEASVVRNDRCDELFPEHIGKVVDTSLLSREKNAVLLGPASFSTSIPKDIPKNAGCCAEIGTCDVESNTVHSMTPSEHESLQKLKHFIYDSGFTLPDGWAVNIRTQNKRPNRVYVSPKEKRFKSMAAVLRYLKDDQGDPNLNVDSAKASVYLNSHFCNAHEVASDLRVNHVSMGNTEQDLSLRISPKVKISTMEQGDLAPLAMEHEPKQVLEETSLAPLSRLSSPGTQSTFTRGGSRTYNKRVNLGNRSHGHWIEALDQVSKTRNINARGVRNCIAESISCGPPEWAREILLPTLGKDVSNAKEVISALLARYSGEEEPGNKNAEMEGRNKKNNGMSGSFLSRMDFDKTMICCPESVTECCRNALREITMKDKFAELFNLVQGKPNELLDFHLIDIRMNAGTYGKSPELFASDMQKMWENVCAVGQKIIVLANVLSECSEAAYQKQVAPLFGEKAGGNNLVDATKKTKVGSANEECLHEPPQNINQHHPSKGNNQLGCIPRAEDDNTLANLNNLKENEQAGNLNGGVEAENISPNKEITSENLEAINQCVSNKHRDLPDIEELKISAHTHVCRSCGVNERDNSIVLCDACDAAYHTYCVSPALEDIPSGSWYCASCVASGKSNKSVPKNNEREGHHCIVCERLSRELEPENSGGVVESHTGGGRMGTCCDGNVGGLQGNKEEFEINQGEGAGREDTEVHVGREEEKLQSNELPVRKLCKVCSSGERDGDNLIECANTNCLFKYFHLSCLKPPLKCNPPPNWFCPSCICVICQVDENDDQIVLCDGCDDGYHIYCVKPRLSAIPKRNWYCSSCRKIKRRRRNKERYPTGNASTEGLQGSNASMVGNASSGMGRGAHNSQDCELNISIPQDQLQATELGSPYYIVPEEPGVNSDENFGSKDNFRISFRTRNTPESGEGAESKESGKRKRKSSEPRRSEG